MLEVLAATFVTALLLTCTVSMLIAAMRACDRDLAQVNTDTNAVIAMSSIVNEVREANSVSILSSGKQLCITLPVMVVDSQGNQFYDRTQPDTAHQINYYTADNTGALGTTGTYLWRAQNGELRRIRSDVDSLVFESDQTQNTKLVSVQITIRTKAQVFKGTKQTDLTQRVVYLRNY